MTDTAPNAVGAATLVALTITVPPAGITGGAVYAPVAVMTPRVALPPAISLTAHVTAVVEVPATVAVNWRLPDTGTDASAGDTATVTCAKAGVAAIRHTNPSSRGSRERLGGMCTVVVS